MEAPDWSDANRKGITMYILGKGHVMSPSEVIAIHGDVIMHVK